MLGSTTPTYSRNSSAMTNYSTMREVRDKQRKTRKERGAGVRDGADGGAGWDECVCG